LLLNQFLCLLLIVLYALVLTVEQDSYNGPTTFMDEAIAGWMIE